MSFTIRKKLRLQNIACRDQEKTEGICYSEMLSCLGMHNRQQQTVVLHEVSLSPAVAVVQLVALWDEKGHYNRTKEMKVRQY